MRGATPVLQRHPSTLTRARVLGLLRKVRCAGPGQLLRDLASLPCHGLLLRPALILLLHRFRQALAPGCTHHELAWMRPTNRLAPIVPSHRLAFGVHGSPIDTLESTTGATRPLSFYSRCYVCTHA